MQGRCDGGKGMRFEAQLRAIHRGGTAAGFRDQLRISGADEAILLLAAATDYRGKDPTAVCVQTLDAAAAKPFDALRTAHLAEHQRLFRRVDLDLGYTADMLRPTDRRLAELRRGAIDPQLAALYFQYGRYLLIGSSRPGYMPANRQGLWAEGLRPPWHCDYATNVHLQMNYWPAEVCNLAECHEPLLEMIESLREPARKTAWAYYNTPRVRGPCDDQRLGLDLARLGTPARGCFRPAARGSAGTFGSITPSAATRSICAASIRR